MDGLGSASPPVAPTATTGEGRHPCTWPRTFWFKPLSAFGLLDLTTFISSSPELAMPSTLAPNRLSASSRRALSREARPPWVGEVTLSQELRTARLPRPHVLVGYQWSHTGLRPGRKTSHNRYIRSFVSHPPEIRPGRCSREGEEAPREGCSAEPGGNAARQEPAFPCCQLVIVSYLLLVSTSCSEPR